MATNSFLGFSEDGTQLFEMKSKMARQVGDDASDSVKSTIRETLGVPASAEGLTPANNLSDVASAATSRTNLDVMAIGQVNNRSNSKGPSGGVNLGASGYLAPGSAYPGTNPLQDNFTAVLSLRVTGLPSETPLIAMLTPGGTDAGWDNGSIHYNTNGTIDASHYGGGSWAELTNILGGAAELNRTYRLAYRINTGDEGLSVFVDGVKINSTSTSAGTSTTLRWQLGTSNKDSSTVEILGFTCFNRALTDAEIADEAVRQVPEVADQWGNGTNLVANGEFSSDTSSWSARLSATLASVSGGQSGNCLEVTQDPSGPGYANQQVTTEVGQRYRLSVYVKEGTSTDGLVRVGSSSLGGSDLVSAGVTATSSWVEKTYEFVATTTTSHVSLWVQNSASQTVLYDTVTVTPIGAVVALLPTPGSIESDGTWLDSSSNTLNGTPTGVTPLISQPSQRGTFTPTLSFAGSSTGVTYSEQLGTWERVGERAIAITGRITLTDKGTHGLSAAAKLEGLPFTSRNANDSSLLTVTGVNLSSLTSAVVGMVYANNTTAKVLHYGASGEVQLDWDNFTNSTVLLFSGTYLIA